LRLRAGSRGGKRKCPSVEYCSMMNGLKTQLLASKKTKNKRGRDKEGVNMRPHEQQKKHPEAKTPPSIQLRGGNRHSEKMVEYGGRM